ncbi:unnamed protein product [Phaeothamnion confervicola]
MPATPGAYFVGAATSRASVRIPPRDQLIIDLIEAEAALQRAYEARAQSIRAEEAAAAESKDEPPLEERDDHSAPFIPPGTAARTGTATGGGGIRLDAGTVGRTRRVLFVDELTVQNLTIDIENRRERLLRYHKDNKTVRSLLVQRCKLHALMVLEGMEDKNDGYGALAALGAAVNGHGEAHLMALRKAVFSPVLSNNMDPDSFRAQYTADKQKLASYGEVVLEHIELSQILSGLGSKYAPVKNAYYYNRGEPWRIADLWEAIQLCHMEEAKQVAAARRDGGVSTAYGVVEMADHGFKNRRNHHQSKRATVNDLAAAELAAAVQPPRPPPAKTRWTRKPPGATGDGGRGSSIAAFGQLDGGGDVGQFGAGSSTPHLPFKGQVGVCYHCGGVGHSWRRCTRMPQEQPAMTHAVQERRVSLGAALPSGNGPPRVNVISAANVFYAGEATLPSAALAAALQTVVHAPIPVREFIVDSGAARTFVADLSFLQCVKEISRPVVAAGGEEYVATHSGVLHGVVEEAGSGRLLEFTILDAEYVPGFTINLLSVCQLHQQGITALFNGPDSALVDARGVKLQLLGDDSGIYKLKFICIVRLPSDWEYPPESFYCLSATTRLKGDGGRSAKMPPLDGDGGGALALTPADAMELPTPAGDCGVLTLPSVAAAPAPEACRGFSEEAQRRCLQLHQRLRHPRDGKNKIKNGKLVRQGRLALDFEQDFDRCEPRVLSKSVKADASEAGAQQRALDVYLQGMSESSYVARRGAPIGSWHTFLEPQLPGGAGPAGVVVNAVTMSGEKVQGLSLAVLPGNDGERIDDGERIHGAL